MNNNKRTPQIRFAGFTDDWEQRKLGEVFVPYIDPVETPNNGYMRLGLRSHTKGTFHSFVEAGKELEAAQMHRVAKDKFILNITFAWEHAIAVTDEKDEGKLVSHRFPQFSFSACLVPIFFKFLILDKKFKNYLELCSPGGAGRNRVLKIKEMLKYEIKIPKTSEEQTAIGNFFKQLDETIALHQREYEKYKNLKISYLEKMFPKENEQFPELRFPEFTDAWEQRKLGEISISFSGGTPNVTNNLYYNGKIPFIRSGEINNKKTELFITELGLENSSAKLVKKGDILYALYGATSGEVGRSKIDGAINQAILAIIPNKNNDPEFISQWLRKHKSIIIQTYLQGGQGNLSGEIVKNLDITIPTSPEEQTAIGNFFKQLDETIALHQRKVEKFKQIKQFYLEKMFV